MLDLALMAESLPRLLQGLHLTLLLMLAVLAVGLGLALPLALAHRSDRRWLRWPAEGYILLFRGTPALVQVFLLYYGAGQFEVIRDSMLWPVLREPFWCFVVALGLNSTAYVGQLLSGALRNLPKGALEAATALGLTRWQALWTVRLPLVVRQIVPAYGNEAILTLKATSLASTITILELTGMARNIVSATYAPYEVFVVAGAIYLAITLVLTRGFALVEARLRLPGA
jgi:His/Glu/Gln/Arg/opine family amino acid ABC transporter permease subunit